MSDAQLAFRLLFVLFWFLLLAYYLGQKMGKKEERRYRDPNPFENRNNCPHCGGRIWRTKNDIAYGYQCEDCCFKISNWGVEGLWKDGNPIMPKCPRCDMELAPVAKNPYFIFECKSCSLHIRKWAELKR